MEHERCTEMSTELSQGLSDVENKPEREKRAVKLTAKALLENLIHYRNQERLS